MIHPFKYWVTHSLPAIIEDGLCVAVVLGGNEQMIKKTVLELQVENINLRAFTILTAGPKQIESFQEADEVGRASPLGGSSCLVTPVQREWPRGVWGPTGGAWPRCAQRLPEEGKSKMETRGWPEVENTGKVNAQGSDVREEGGVTETP